MREKAELLGIVFFDICPARLPGRSFAKGRTHAQSPSVEGEIPCFENFLDDGLKILGGSLPLLHAGEMNSEKDAFFQLRGAEFGHRICGAALQWIGEFTVFEFLRDLFRWNVAVKFQIFACGERERAAFCTLDF